VNLCRIQSIRSCLVVLAVAFTYLSSVTLASAQVTAFRQAVAETAALDEDLAAFYRARDFDGIWTGDSPDVQLRRNAFLGALSTAAAHGLPAARYDTSTIIAQLRAARSPADQGRMEVELSRLFLQYARDVQTGVLTPHEVIALNFREVPLRDRLATLQRFVTSPPATFLRSLPPTSPEYVRLMRAKLQLEALIVAGGWGPEVAGGPLEPGAAGDHVIALRNRLIAMGYLARSVTRTYDDSIAAAVEAFQTDHGLTVDGVVGQGTLDEINVPVSRRLQSVIVAMERERWINMPLGERHVWVNLADFTARIVDGDRVTFQTRSVVGANADDRQSPEFSDVMEFMVINPSWSVPRNIVTREYLPSMQRNPGAAGQLQLIDSAGRVVNRANVNFGAYNASNFPYALRQAPGAGNALGVVKFMFPNSHNIYLHDTPSRDLFSREIRAFSHGCIRLNDPRDFAYALLAQQTDDPQGLFASHLNTGAESRLDLAVPVPVHLDYRTAFTTAVGGMEYRRDVYGRDAAIWSALSALGVEIPAVQG
jgi:L,D-transpeptidase YcbB